MQSTHTLVFALLALLVVGCEDPKQSSSHRQATSSVSAPEPPKRKTPTVPADVSYSIIESTAFRDLKRSLTIRLNKRVSEETLRALAVELKSKDPKKYKRTFIAYYLPDMQVGAGAWATTHYNPHMEIKILGLTIDQEKALKQQPSDPSRKIIGRWIDDRPHVGHKITVFRNGRKVYWENFFPDGSSNLKEVISKPSPIGRKILDKGGNDFGEYYVVGKDGHLQMRDKDGIFYTAKKITD